MFNLVDFGDPLFLPQAQNLGKSHFWQITFFMIWIVLLALLPPQIQIVLQRIVDNLLLLKFRKSQLIIVTLFPEESRNQHGQKHQVPWWCQPTGIQSPVHQVLFKKKWWIRHLMQFLLLSQNSCYHLMEVSQRVEGELKSDPMMWYHRRNGFSKYP